MATFEGLLRTHISHGFFIGLSVHMDFTFCVQDGMQLVAQ